MVMIALNSRARREEKRGGSKWKNLSEGGGE